MKLNLQVVQNDNDPRVILMYNNIISTQSKNKKLIKNVSNNPATGSERRLRNPAWSQPSKMGVCLRSFSANK